MKRNVKRWGAWIMALVMLCSLVMVPAGKVEAAVTSQDILSSEVTKTEKAAKDEYTSTPFVDYIFDIPDAIKTNGANGYESLSLQVNVTLTDFTTASSMTVGLYAMDGTYGNWKDNYAESFTEKNKNVTITLPLTSYSNIGKLGLRITGATEGTDVNYTIHSAKLIGIKKSESGSEGGGSGETDLSALGKTSDNVTATCSQADGSNPGDGYYEYTIEVKNQGTENIQSWIAVATVDKVITENEAGWDWAEVSTGYSDTTLYIYPNTSKKSGSVSTGNSVTYSKFGYKGGSIQSVTVYYSTAANAFDAFIETVKTSSGGSAGTTDDYTGTLTYTLPSDCVDDADVTPLAQHGALHVDLNTLKLTDANGNPFQLRGVSTHGINWADVGYPYVNFQSFKNARDVLGANAVRLVNYTTEYYGYVDKGSADKSQSYVQSDMKYRIDKGVKCATALGMYAIVDWHVLKDLNPLTNKEVAKQYFEYMSAQYKDYDNILYEICNEPNGGTSWSDIKKYAEEIIPIIRKNDPDAIIIVGTPTWSQDVDIAKNDPLKDSDGKLMSNVMYTVHFYAAEHTENYRNKVKAAVGTIPIFCTEYGMCMASGSGANNFTQATAWLDYLDSECISYFVWNLSQKPETSSLFVSGNATNWTAANLSESGKWIKEQYAARKDVNNTVSTDPIAVTGVTLNKETLEMVVGETETLKATLKPSNATEKGLSWKSSNETVATVDDNGMVTAVASGETTITVTTVEGTFKATCKVIVNKSTPTIEGVDTITVDYGTVLKDIDLSGYKAVIDNATVEGTFNWENGEITVSTETENKAYKLLFQPTDGTKYETASKSITVKGQKVANNRVPDKPELESKTATSVTLKPYSGTEKIQYGYKDVSGEYTWVDSNEITGLDEWTKYEFALRFAETATTKEGQAGDSITVITNLKDIYKVDLGKLSEEGYIEAHDGSISYDEGAKILTLEETDKKYTLTGDGSEITIKVKSSTQENMPNIILEDVTAKGIDADKDLLLGLIGDNTIKNDSIKAGGTLTIDNEGTTKVGTLDVESENFGAILADNVIVKGGNINATGKEEAVAIKASTKIELVGGAVTANAETQPVIQAGDGTEQNPGEIIWDGCAFDSTSDNVFSPNPKKSDGTEIKDICNVIYEGGKPFTVPKGEEMTINESVPVKKGFHAKGWKIDGEEDVLEIGKKITITKNITLVPAYDEIEGKLSIVQDTTVAPLVEGYTKDDGVAVTIINNTNVTFEDIKLAINSNEFELDEDKLEQLTSKESYTVKVKLRNGKAAGTYTTQLTVTVSSGEIDPKNAIINRTVKNAVIKVTGINVNLDKNAIELADNQSVTVKATATVLPENATNKQVTWTTSDSKIATVDSNGVVTVVGKDIAEGTTAKVDIIATTADGSNITGKATLTVTKKKTEEKPDPDDSDKDPNKPAEEKPNGSGGQNGGSSTGATGNTPPQTPAAPSAADEVKATGIQVTADVKKADNMLVAGTMKLAPKKKMQLNVAFLPEDADEEEVTFTSSNPKVAIVDEDGEITAGKNPGKTTITVKTASGLVKTFQIQVMKKAVTKVKLQVKTKNLKVGKTMKVKATLSPNKKLASNIIYWTSSNEDVVTVTQKGVVKGLKKGKAKITAVATDGSGKKATVTIKVK